MMHADEVHVDAPLVRRLLAAQLPRWSSLPLRRVAGAGTDNAIWRLGDAMCVRLPRIASAAEQVEKLHTWLPRLAPHLPLRIPALLAMGAPGEGYPWPWSVCDWIEGETATLARIGDARRAASDLGYFVAALRAVDATGAPAPGSHNFHRGVPLATRDARTRAAIDELRDALDARAALRAWESALAAPPWDAAPAWIHGDLQEGNLLARDGRLRAVIDFGGLGAGDPACDLMAAWTYLPVEVRDAFRDVAGLDDAAWARGRGWALSFAVIALPYYRSSNPVLARIARRTIDAVLADH